MFNPIYSGGILLPDQGLWMDPRRKKPFAIVSHAHGDHVARHSTFLATPATIALIRVRMGDALANRALPLPYGEIHSGPNYQIRLHPAGHVLGSAMVEIEVASERFLYTGDFKTRPGLSTEAIQIPEAEHLLMETTFGSPQYTFPPFEDSCAQIHTFCNDALADGKTPVLLAYSLGKAQEVLKILESRSEALMVHRSIRELNQVYQQFGCNLPVTRPLDFLNLSGCIAVIPPAVLKKLPRNNCATAMISGWGIDPAARFRYGVDAVLPLSDHADYNELLDFVAQVAPRKVYTTHGYDQAFAAELRRRNYDAWSLSGRDQLEFPI